MQPLYFLPNTTREKLGADKFVRTELATRGLAETFADVYGPEKDAWSGNVAVGPNGSSGVVLTYAKINGTLPEPIGYKPEKQTWQQVNEGLWIGTTNDSPPTPEDMARKQQVNGQWLEFDDGQRWAVPILRQPITEATALPSDMAIDDVGNVVQTVKARYRKLWEDAEDTALWFLPELDERPDRGNKFGGDTYTLAIGLRRAVEVLGLNYRFSIVEQNALKIIDSTTYMGVLAWSIDLPTLDKVMIAAAQKKTTLRATGLNTSPGPAGLSEIIDQAAAS